MPGELERFYSASLERGVDGVLEHLTQRFAVAAIGITSRSPHTAVQRWRGLEPAFEHAYLTSFHARDPYVQGALRLGLPEGRCGVGREFTTAETRASSPLIHELFRPFGFSDLQGGILSRSGETLVSLGMMRELGAPDFERSDADALEAYFPHIRNALTVATLVERARGFVAAARLCPRRRLVETFGDDRWLGRVFVRARGEVSLRDARRDPEFIAAIARASTQRVPSPVLASGALLLVTPSPLGGARVEIHDVFTPCGAAREHLQRTFRLSPAEVELACAISSGESPAEFADRRGVAISTVRTQLRAVFRKTGTAKQSALVALVAALERLG